MKRQKTLIIFSLGFFLGLLVLSGLTPQPAQAQSEYQSTPCEAALADAANRAGIVAEDEEWNKFGRVDETDPWDHCSVDYYWGKNVNEEATFSILRDNGSDLPACGDGCEKITFRGYLAMVDLDSKGSSFEWYTEGNEVRYWLSAYRGGYIFGRKVAQNDDKVEAMAMAEAPWSATEGKLPGAEGPPSGPVQSNSDCAGVTPEKLRAGGVAVLQCRLHCDPNIMSDSELLACINQYSGQSGEPPPIPVDPGSEPPPIPDNPDTYIPPVEPPPDTNPFAVAWDSLPAGLIRNPLIPIAGGLTGAALAWLFSQLGTRPIPGSTQPKGVPPIDANAQGLYWSERPGDAAGPGYVSKEEYEQTKSMLEQGYKWTNGGWQTPEEIQQSNQLQENNRAAVAREQAAREQAAREQAARENAARQAQREQERQEAIRAQREKLDKLEAESQKNQYKSPINVELSAEAGNSGALSSSEMEQGAGFEVGVYKEAYYDADDKLGDVTVGGYDIGGWKADVQLGKAQAGGGLGYDKKTGNLSAGGFFEISSAQVTGEGVVGNEYLGVTSDGQIDGPKAEGFLGYKDGSVGVSLGGSLVSAETGMGLNVAGANVGMHSGISFGLEFGFTVGKETEIKFGPFKLGLSFGSAKTAQ